MGKKAKKATDYDEILKEQQHLSNANERLTSSSISNQGFFSRSLSRISGRRKRQKKRTAAENFQDDNIRTKRENQVLHHQCSSTNDRNLTGLTHLEGDEARRKKHFLTRSMDRLRRSIRRSFQRGGGQAGQALTSSTIEGLPSSSMNTQPISGNCPTGAVGTSNKSYCHSDEVAVRSAACSFQVKYLGACEVFESRGMLVCESALQHLRTRKRALKALLYVSGDGIRVVDQKNHRGLIVDQTIEKVSFCSPDRHNDKGFAYICRDGATRRWICHGFHATKESGERISHAVGCAFTVCLERKRKRDAESEAYKDARAFDKSLNSPKNHKTTVISQSGSDQIDHSSLARTNQGYSSFRHLSISERRLDPQKAILVEHGKINPINSLSTVVSSKNVEFTPTPRPSGNPSLFERSRSLRSLSGSTFPAFNSLPPVPESKNFNSISHPITDISRSRTFLPRKSLFNEPIWEGDDDQQISTGIKQNSIDNNYYIVNWNSHFYKTMPHSMPSFVEGGLNNWSLPSINSMIPPPIIYEESKQQNQSTLQQSTVPMQMQSHKNFEDDNRGSGNSSPPADPFTTTNNNQHLQESPHLEGLEQHFRQAATLSRSSSSLICDGLPPSMVLPRSATINWMPPPVNQTNDVQQLRQSWTQFPQQQFPKAIDMRLQQPLPTLPSLSSSAKIPSWTRTNQKQNVTDLPFPSNMKHNTSLTPNPPSPLNLKKGSSREEPLTTAKTHARKSSSGRRIEYQLLQETDVSLSPPRNDYSSLYNKEINDFPASIAIDKLTSADPFDVNWSQKVLEETARQHKKNIGSDWSRDALELEKTFS